MKLGYRIKVSELNNGEVWYTPQVQLPGNKLLRIFGIKGKWLNIITREENRKMYWVEEESSMSFLIEERAMELMDGYRSFIGDEYGKQTKSTNYKKIK